MNFRFFYIEGTRYTRMTVTEEATVFEASVIADEAEPPPCECGLTRLRNGDHIHTVMDSPAHGARIKVLVSRQRYRCAAGLCKSYMHPLPAVPEGGRNTYRLRHYIAERVIHRPFSDLAVDTGVDRSTIRRIFDEIAEPKIAAIHANAPRVLGIDEFKLRGRFRCILTDVENRRPYDLLEAHNAETVVSRLQQMPHGVQVVVMDMSENFRASVLAARPDVVIVADRFHLVKYINGKLDEFRRETRKARRADKSTKGVKDRRFLLMTRQSDLNEDQRKTLAKWLDTYPGMREVAEAKWELEKVFYCTSRAEAEEHLRKWNESLGAVAQAVFAGVIAQFDRWREPILAYFDHRFTAGYTEAMNGIIKDIDQRGRGLAWSVLRARFILSRDRLVLANARRHSKPKARHTTRKRIVSRRRRGPVSPVKALEPFAGAVRDVVAAMKTSAKLIGLGGLITQLKRENPEKWRLVIFTGRRETQTTIQGFLEENGFKVGIINGSSGSRNQATLAAFRANPPEFRIIVSTEAGSEGVNLQVANVLVNYDLPWNPMIVEQRIGRIQRLASEHANVSIFNITLRKTFEDYIVGRLMEKLQMATSAIGDIESLLQGAGVDGEDEAAGFEEKIRQLVVAALKGADVEGAVRLAEKSIADAKETLQREEQRINDLLGGMDSRVLIATEN